MASQSKPRIMSWRVRISLAVVLGAASAVAVAWGAALFPVEEWLGIKAPVFGLVILEHKPGECWVAYVSGELSPLACCMEGQLSRCEGYDEGRGLLIMEVGGSGTKIPTGSVEVGKQCLEKSDLDGVPRGMNEWVQVNSFGWPLRSMVYRQENDLSPGTFVPPVTRWGYDVPMASLRYARNPPVLPLMPRWWALGADIGVYSVVWLALLLLPRIVRAVTWRVWRRCPVCGYDRRGIGGGARCPECGAPGGERVAA